MYPIVKVLTLFLLIVVCSEVAAKSKQTGVNGNWGYRNRNRYILPKEWPTKWPNCGGKRQSPINIVTNDTRLDKTLKKLTIREKKIDKTVEPNIEVWQIRNSAQTISLLPLSHEFSFLTKPENEEFKLLQMHFHWRGSEHTFNSRHLAGELHLVHQSVKDPKKFAVLGYLLRESSRNNKHLMPITEELRNVIKNDSKKNIKTFKLSRLIPFSIPNYFRYPGSLTVPECLEVVEWFVIDRFPKISNEQLLDFQSIEDTFNYPVLTNSRPVEKLNGRVVRRSFNFRRPPRRN